MVRSIKKGPYVSEKLLKKIKNLKPGEKTVIKTWCRACTITPEMVGLTFGVHNGKDFISVKATEDMVGHKLGEFSPTTKFSRHGGRMQREMEAKVVEKEAAKVKETETVKGTEKVKEAEKAKETEKVEETKSA
jgi:small subunit ribosomal protein S19